MVHHPGKTGLAMGSSKNLTVQYATGQIGELISLNFPQSPTIAATVQVMRQVTAF
jgi:hypothetical protein